MIKPTKPKVRIVRVPKVLTVIGKQGPPGAGEDGTPGGVGPPGPQGTAGAAGPSNLITESGGPTNLTVGAIADKALFQRSGVNAIGWTLHGETQKSTPVGADEILLADSAASFAMKRATLTDVFTALGGSSGSNWSDIHVAPTSPDSDDEEYNGTSVSANMHAFRGDTMAAITPSAGVDLWTTVATANTQRWQQGARSSWLSVQPWDFNAGGGAISGGQIHTYKALGTAIGTNFCARIRFARTGAGRVSRDGNFQFYLYPQATGAPTTTGGMFVQISGLQTGGTPQIAFGGGGGSTTTRNLSSYNLGQYDCFAITKRGSNYYGWVGGAGTWELIALINSATTFVYVGFGCAVDVGTVVPHTIHHVDYMRFNRTGILP